jgi:hypothetical protein
MDGMNAIHQDKSVAQYFAVAGAANNKEQEVLRPGGRI